MSSAKLVKELRDRTGLGMMECKKALKECDGDLDAAIEHLRKTSGMKAAKKAGRVAADGVVSIKVADDAKSAVMVEVNSETDFAARDAGFLGFVAEAVDGVAAGKQTDIAALMAAGLEPKREALVQKIGENISVRRAVIAEGDVVGGYVHGNSRIAVLVTLNGGSTELAKDIAMHIAAVNPQFVNPDSVPAEVVAKEKEILVAQSEGSGKPAEIIEKMVVGRVRKFLSEISLTEQAFVKNPDQTVGQLAKDAGAEIVSFTRYEVGEGIEVEEKDFAAEVAEQLAGK